MLEERSGHSADLSSAGAAGRGSPPGGFPGLLPDSDTEAQTASECAGTAPPSGAGKAGHDSNAGRLFSYHRWPPPYPASIHGAGTRKGFVASSSEAQTSTTAPSTNYRFCLVRPSTQNVVETFLTPPLKLKDFPASFVPDCENSANTHSLASLYQAFPPEEARRLANRLDIHHT